MLEEKRKTKNESFPHFSRSCIVLIEDYPVRWLFFAKCSATLLKIIIGQSSPVFRGK